MHTRRTGWRLGAIVASALALGAGVMVGCGDDDEEPANTAVEETGAQESSPAEVTVTADEYSFDLSETPTGGETTFRLVNEGKEFHVMLLAKINEGFTLEEAFEMEGEEGSAEELGALEAPPGQEAKKTVEADLEPGEYAMVCPVTTKAGKSHFELGQRVEFSIE